MGFGDKGSTRPSTNGVAKLCVSDIRAIASTSVSKSRRLGSAFGAISSCVSNTKAAASALPIRSEARSRLLAGIARTRLWLDEIITGRVADTSALAEREGISERAARQMLWLAFLAPGIVEAAASGTLPRGFGLSRLTDLPPGWDAQRSVLGIAG